MNYTVLITPESKDLIQQHLELGYPNEACGFLLGEDHGESRTIQEVIAVPNVQKGDQKRRFAIAPLDYIQAERIALEKGLQLLGIYHSHPNHPALPSIHDLQQALPFFSYFIWSVQDRHATKLTSWRLNEQLQEFEEEKILVLTYSI
ncbi:MAG: M67 family metallopeptidase [Aureispira sp.]|nr:M67 family metallopeptidase [Aureispira sp.]